MTTTPLTDTPTTIDITEPRPSGRGRRIAFRILLAVSTLVLLPLILIGMAELVFAWLPEATVRAITDDPNLTPGVYDAHRTHHLATGLMAIAYLPSLLVQLRRPERRLASLTLLVALPVFGAVVYALSGTFTDWLIEELVLLAPIVAVAALHPRARDLFGRIHLRVRMGVLAAVAAVPWLVYAGMSAVRQATHVAGDIHGEAEHWATMALIGLTISTAALLGASTRDGWRLPAGIAAAMSMLLGTNSLLFPSAASALATPMAVAAIAWGAVYAVAAFRRSGRDTADATHLA